ncbi:hypothetical protein HME9304_03135 [Flagellimonas maritima]|uniref:Lipocalin-like domain-containing protein n=1 Tax=Flagellimonas maritima TaxID=1383885 RepID=A0A2Z4LWN6_9FLAO|nr:hypothetical protein [Allomuricauda aurantiaca]AWX46103.1 hypothetical protein HME9304_03135 [Allomuricauda aurantiaca]
MTNIKKSFFIFFLISTLLSCNINDDNNGVEPPNFNVIGLWDLVEVNVSAEQDIDSNGAASKNLVDEMDCIFGTLLIDGDLVWTYNQTPITITSITNDQFAFSCSDTVSASGTWFSDEIEATFSGDDVLSTLKINGGMLVNEVGNELPGIQSFVYELRKN